MSLSLRHLVQRLLLVRWPFLWHGCGETAAEAEPTGVTPQAMADALHTVMAADRTVYTKFVVNRLVKQEKVIKASEQWTEDKALPLPAQMFRMGAEHAAESNANFTYGLLSQWPINQQHAPKTDVEKEGLQFIADNPDDAFYSEETLGGQTYFTAIYGDKAVAAACVDCHNEHPDSPRDDFVMNEVMGGVIIRIPLN